jgi:hypothetical protein
MRSTPGGAVQGLQAWPPNSKGGGQALALHSASPQSPCVKLSRRGPPLRRGDRRDSALTKLAAGRTVSLPRRRPPEG